MPYGEKTKLLWQNPEYKKHMSEAHKGQIAWNKDKKMPQFSGEKNSNYRGGRIKRSGGYIYILKPKHPFCDKDGYIAEHRLVAEKILNRLLEPKETSHHLNDIRSDNRPKNLFIFEHKGKHNQFHHYLKSNPFLRTWLESNLI